MAWYGRRRSGEPRVGARAIVVGLGLSMIGVLAIQTGNIVRGSIDESRRSMDATAANLATFSAGISRWQFGFGTSKEAQARIAELESQLQESQRDRQRWKDIAQTNTLRMTRYEQLLDLVGETQGPSVMARVVAEKNDAFAATRIANAGVANGVREGFAALNEHGLVGRVIRVGEYTSRILLLTDRSSRIPVMGAKSGDRALLVGDGGSGATLVEPETPDRIVEGEVWVTSGDDGQMPLGIVVGVARRAPEGWRVDLAMTKSRVDFVRLSPPPDFASPDDAPPLNDGAPQPNSRGSLVSSSAPLATPPSQAGSSGRAAVPTPAQRTSRTPQQQTPRPTPQSTPSAPPPAATPAATPDATPAQPAGQGAGR